MASDGQQRDELHGVCEVLCLPDGRYYPRRGGKYGLERIPPAPGEVLSTARRISFATEAEAWSTLEGSGGDGA